MVTVVKSIPYLVIQRFAKYLLYLRYLREKSVNYTFSHKMAECLGITSQTVRRDLLYLNFSGKPKKGYEVVQLEKTLFKLFGVDTEKKAVVVGAGNIGRGMILHKNFLKYGFNICAIFDSNKRIIGKKVGCFKVKPMSLLAKVVQDRNAKIGIIAVPPESTQKVADQLVEAGIRGLLNFADAHILVPKHIFVHNIHIVGSLLELSGIMRVKTHIKP